MEFIIATLSSLFASAGGWIAAALAAIAALFGGVIYHKAKVSKAEDKGQKDGAAIERDRIERETREEIQQLKEEADEIKAEIRRGTATDDDLRERMRSSASDRDSK